MDGRVDNIERVIEPGVSFRTMKFAELYRYRELLTVFIWRNVSTKYRQMALGVIWVWLEPLAQVAIMSIFFGMLLRIPSGDIPYPVFVLSAFLPWIFFVRVQSECAGSIRENIGVISKVYFPRILLPIAAPVKPMIDMMMTMAALLLVMLAYGYYPSVRFLAGVPFLVIALCVGFAIGLLQASIIVRYRDIYLVANLGIQVWMYATPIIYPPQLVPAAILPFYMLNPMYWVVEGFRWALLNKPVDFTYHFPLSLLCVFALLVVSIVIFLKTERVSVDYE